jgi:hypothetical protein
MRAQLQSQKLDGGNVGGSRWYLTAHGSDAAASYLFPASD